MGTKVVDLKRQTVLKRWLRLFSFFAIVYILTIPLGFILGAGYLYLGHGSIPKIEGEISILLWLSSLWFPLWWSPAVAIWLNWFKFGNNVLKN